MPIRRNVPLRQRHDREARKANYPHETNSLEYVCNDGPRVAPCGTACKAYLRDESEIGGGWSAKVGEFFGGVEGFGVDLSAVFEQAQKRKEGKDAKD